MMDFAHLENRAKTLRPSAVKLDPNSVYPNEPRKEVLLVCFSS